MRRNANAFSWDAAGSIPSSLWQNLFNQGWNWKVPKETKELKIFLAMGMRTVRTGTTPEFVHKEQTDTVTDFNGVAKIAKQLL